MDVDFSKMTNEQFQLINETRDRINNIKKKLALIKIDISALDEPCFMDVLHNVSELNNNIEICDEKLKKYEI